MPLVLACRRAGAALLLAGTVVVGGAAEPADDGWLLVGHQGLIAQVLVPLPQARDRAAYARQIERLCAERETCFVNFYTNTTGAAVTLPLPDAIAREATATLRRSAKQGVEAFRWSCRLAMPEPDCF